MNLNNISVIISREYSTRVRKKSFLVITFVVPILMAAVMVLPTILMLNSKDRTQVIEVLDESEIVLPYLENGRLVEYVNCAEIDLETLKTTLQIKNANAVLHISPLSEQKAVSVELYSQKPLTSPVKDKVKSQVDAAIEDYRLSSYDIPEIKTLIDEAKADIKVSTFTIGEDGKEKITSSEVYGIISMVLAMIIYMFITMFGAMVMNSVIEEKSSKVVEVLVSSVKSTELMFGKIIGVALVALTQFLLWIAVLMVLVVGFQKFVGVEAVLGDVSQEQMSELVEAGSMGMNSVELGESSDMADIVATLGSLEYGQLIFAFLTYFLLGYLLYASLFAAIGSAVDNEADTSQLQLPVTIPLMLGIFMAIYAFRAPDSGIAVWGSMIPLTSPIVMLARIPFGVPAWQIWTSIALLAASFLLLAWASAKIYKVGLLMSGKKSTFADLWKWLNQK